MKEYKIKSPNGKNFIIMGETIYHAVQKAVEVENYKYSNIDYLKINKYDKNRPNRKTIY